MNRVVNGIRLWCSTSSGSSQPSIRVLGAGVMMGFAILVWVVILSRVVRGDSIVSVGVGLICGFRSMRVCR